MIQQAIIVGGGPGGLCTALALARHGIDVDIYEQASEFKDIGAGLQLSANAMLVLRWLGLSEAIDKVAVKPSRAIFKDYQSGKEEFSAPLNPDHKNKYGENYYHIHRADLHQLLVETARAENIGLHTQKVATGYTQTSDQVTLKMDTGETVSGDILIGADGLGSTIRHGVIGATEPVFTGHTAWRGIVPVTALAPDLLSQDAHVWLGPDRHFVSYYIRQAKLINFIAVEERREWFDEGWSVKGNIEELQTAFAGWDRPVTEIVKACTECYFWGLHEHPPLPRWSDGRVALLGDACHPMLPFMAQGAAMAIEDAYTLAKVVSDDTTSLATALTFYEQKRKPRTSMIQSRSRANADLYHRRSQAGRIARILQFKAGEKFPFLANAVLDKVYGVDVTKE
ncbi:MAG: FAD-dependent monooxygenase [bacterium]